MKSQFVSGICSAMSSTEFLTLISNCDSTNKYPRTNIVSDSALVSLKSNSSSEPSTYMSAANRSGHSSYKQKLFIEQSMRRFTGRLGMMNRLVPMV